MPENVNLITFLSLRHAFFLAFFISQVKSNKCTHNELYFCYVVALFLFCSYFYLYNAEFMQRAELCLIHLWLKRSCIPRVVFLRKLLL